MSVTVSPRPRHTLWPPPAGTRVVLLARRPTPVESEILEAYVAGLRAAGLDAVRAGDGDAALAAAASDDVLVAPMGVVWLPADGQRHGVRELSVAAAPAALRTRAQRRVLGRDPSRCRIVVGEPATVAELRARRHERGGEAGDASALARFVERQADIVLERDSRRLTGDRYRAPRRVPEELTEHPDFTAGVRRLADELGRDVEGVHADARAYVDELATRQSPVARDLWAQWSKFLYARGYELRVDEASLARLRELAARHPLVFLPSHRSNLDAYVMASMLHEHGFPPNHTLGGINMAFWPIGPVGRRVGVIFIRRSFRDNEIYKFALRRYLGFLVSKRFNLEWYIEGGRSRTGKLLPPRMGLLGYLADAVEEQGIDDVHVVPVSIVYDELQEATEMTAESHGAVKPAEGLGWLLRFARQQQGSFGAVHVSFGEPLVLTEHLRRHGSAPEAPEGTRRLARSKVAFEICARINAATPVTANSLLTLALLGAGDRALTLAEVEAELEPVLAFVRRRRLPGGSAAETLGRGGAVRRTLDVLVEHGVVERFAGGPEPVYRIGPDRELVAAFYRNAAIHWFLTPAIAELATLAPDPLEECLRLRDLLKFEFFFAERDRFLADAREELAHADDSGFAVAPRVLRSFLEAHWIVAEHLVRCGDAAVTPGEAKPACLALGRQLRLQRRVRRAEAVSSHLFGPALKLAANRDLLGPGRGDARRAFAAELADVLARLATLEARDAVEVVA